MLTDKQKINQLEIIIDRLMYKLEENEDIYYFMIERDDYEECQRDYEHYQKESEV
tara:strand:- start:283 stop:447 length:165 start_codon:yes stop_codon:yes gene_type:complete